MLSNYCPVRAWTISMFAEKEKPAIVHDGMTSAPMTHALHRVQGSRCCRGTGDAPRDPNEASFNLPPSERRDVFNRLLWGNLMSCIGTFLLVDMPDAGVEPYWCCRAGSPRRTR